MNKKEVILLSNHLANGNAYEVLLATRGVDNALLRDVILYELIKELQEVSPGSLEKVANKLIDEFTD